jgi:hypothetical protein
LFRAADCDTDQYLVVANFRDRLAVSKIKNVQISYGEVSLKKLIKIEGKEQ